MNDINLLKKNQRKKFIHIRRKKNLKYINQINLETINNLLDKKIFKNVKIVSSFFSIDSEISTNNLNEYIIKKNKILTFPIVKKKKQILSFRKFKNNQKLILGNYDIPEPPEENEELIPDLIFVPCLAFDVKGYRLGYGGGYYDKTFAYFKNINHDFISIGFAYDFQKTNHVYTNEFDYKLNYVLTEKQLYKFL